MLPLLAMFLIVVFCQTKEVTSNGEEALALVPSEKEEAEEPRGEHQIIGKSPEVAIETRKEYTVSNDPCGTKLHPLSRIKFGKEVGGEHEWPFMAHVAVTCHVKGKIRQMQTCGGTVVEKRWILTSGHCTHVNMTLFETNECDEWKQPFFEESKIRLTANQRKEMFMRVKPNEMEVIVGHKDYTKGTKKHVLNIIRHEHFRSNEFKNDLALLELTVPLEFGPNVSRICLDKKEPASIEPATIISWGPTKGGTTSYEFDIVNIKQKIASNTNNNNIYPIRFAKTMSAFLQLVAQTMLFANSADSTRLHTATAVGHCSEPRMGVGPKSVLYWGMNQNVQTKIFSTKSPHFVNG